MQNLWKQVADQYCTSAEEVQDEPQPEDVVAWIAAQLLAAGILPESAAVSEQPEMAVKR